MTTHTTQNEARQDYDRIICTQKWRRMSLQMLADHPTCEICHQAAATEVHHITPIQRGNDHAERLQLAFDVKNLQAVCHQCHMRQHATIRKNKNILHT